MSISAMRSNGTSPRLLGVFAHPDDESFGAGGTLARYARCGVAVHVCTVTDGAAGTVVAPSVPEAGATTLAELRRRELECAGALLGASLHPLTYRDSGMAGSADNLHPASLFQARLEDVVHDLVRVIRTVRPHVIITHELTGGYHHPDHVKVSQAVELAWAAASDAGYPVQGLAPWAPRRLYHQVVPRRVIRRFVRRLLAHHQDPRHFGANGDIDLTGLGTPDRAVHVCLDVRPWLPIKLAACACHRSQGAGLHWPEFLGRRAMGFEHFVQVQPPAARRHRDLFEGVGNGEWGMGSRE
jgi:mycothiol S-conjugate amidase